MIVNFKEKIAYSIKKLAGLDKTIMFSLLLLAIINILVQYSANDKVLSRLFTDIIYLLVSFIILMIIASFNPGQFKSITVWFYIITLVLLVLVLVVGVKSHGAKRWLNIGIRLQPSELCKLSVPLMLSYYFSNLNGKPKLLNFLYGALLILIPFILIAKQPDLGTAILVFASGFFVLFFAGLNKRLIIISLIIILSATPIIWHFLHDYQQHRILTLIHPASDPLGKGYHVIQGIIAIGSGGLFGKGYLHGTQIHLDFIPEKHTDFVITVLAEEFGFVGVLILISIYLVIIFRALKIMHNSSSIFEETLAGSLTLSFALYILINMGMVAGIFPVVGVPLPLISYGGTATIVLMAGFGMILSIVRHSKY